MTRILGISGSLRAGSYNTALLRAAQGLSGPGIRLEIATLHGIPVYDGDLETREGSPPAVAALKEKVIAADGVLLATPEYNNGVPGSLKNAIDWLSRPPGDIGKVFGNRPFAVIGASQGGFGTILSQAAWLPILRHLGARQWHGGRLLVSRAQTVFDAEGKLTDPAIAKQLGEFVNNFAASLTQH
ncbi:MAG TPA: NAD(P)H-dependent oxidoreductase [Steroidobacteraceae bacterium]|nr:NAD(P)H-dependent oxidoreductase [Steroidobacteraceae bacterium]